MIVLVSGAFGCCLFPFSFAVFVGSPIDLWTGTVGVDKKK